MTDSFDMRATSQSSWPGRLCVGCVIVGIVLVLVSLGLTLRSRAWVKTAMRTQGTIVAIKPAPRSNDGGQTYYPVYEAAASDGHTFNVTGNVSSFPAPTIGGRAMLAYPPGKPGEAVLIGFLGIWFFPIIVGAIGMVWTAIGMIILLVASHPQKAPAARA